MKTQNQLTFTGANNAIEAKIIVDAYLETLTDEMAFKLLKVSMKADTYFKLGFEISAAIGSGSYYYGAECKRFPNEVIKYEITNRACNYAALLKA